MRIVLCAQAVGEAPSVRRIGDDAVLAEQLGFDGYGVADGTALTALWPRTIEAIAERTSRIPIVGTVLGLWLPDPSRALRDYSALNRGTGGRLELVLGSSTPLRPGRIAHQHGSYELFRRFWGLGNTVDAPWIWHRCTLRRSAVDLAARFGDPILLADISAPDAGLRDWYRSRLAFHGHDPDRGLVGAGGLVYYGARRSQDAFAAFRPGYEARVARARLLGLPVAYPTAADAVRAGAVLVGSPQQIVDALLAQRQRLYHDVLHLHADTTQNRDALELFQSDIAPALRLEADLTSRLT